MDKYLNSLSIALLFGLAYLVMGELHTLLEQRPDVMLGGILFAWFVMMSGAGSGRSDSNYSSYG